MARWVKCRYHEWDGREVGLSFSYGNEKQLREIFERYQLSKDRFTMYNVYEDGKLIYSMNDE